MTLVINRGEQRSYTRKRGLCIAGMVFLLATTQAVYAEGRSSLNVATFNLRMDTPSDGNDSWPNRKEKVKGLIRFHDFDIFGTQEAFIHQIKDILELKAYDYAGVGRDDGMEAGEHSAIFYKKDRFEALDKGNYWLSLTPEVPSFGWDAKIRRICSWAKFKDRANGNVFYFFCVHYDHQGTVARRESSLLMLERIKSIAGDTPFFCTGDFNATPESEPIQIIYKDGTLVDSKQITAIPPYGTKGTFHGFNVNDPAQDRLDYIFVSKGIRVNKYGVLNDIQYGHFPSDHYPVMINAEISPTFDPVDYVNPLMGNISHMLVPTYPTVHLPNSMMRVFPVRSDYTGNVLKGLPLMVVNHRSASTLNVIPWQGDESGISAGMTLSYDREKVSPYRYRVYLDEARIDVDYAPSHQSAVYSFGFEKGEAPWLVLQSRGGVFNADGNVIQGFQTLGGRNGKEPARLFFHIQTDVFPVEVTGKTDGSLMALRYPENTAAIGLRYGVSFISEEQAKANLEREIQDYDVEAVAMQGRKAWNEALGKIKIQGGEEDEKTVFYTSLYRVFERPVNISEDGRYFSGFDGQVHSDGGRPFYTDDWIWDTYRAAHPLRVIIDKDVENDIVNSYLLMAEQAGTNWIPTFPGVTGDSRSMNSTHSIAMVIDAYNKGIRGFDLEKAYAACRQGLEERSVIPWSDLPAGELDAFYREKGYFPALKPGEKETVPGVHSWEKRQPMAVTLGTSYDHWCLSLIARELGRTEEADYYLQCSYNYRNVFNPSTGFFHPKDKDGNFIEPFDYRISGGPGARDYYDENNGYVYRWDVQHNIADLIDLIGGNGPFINALEDMYNTPYGMPRWEFYNTLPDHTGNVGMFSMANEPSLHVPYLYNYAGQPWRTQKRIRNLLQQWFRNDLMGVPGDEDGGGMSAFVAFSLIGFYPVTPGSPTYNIGSPAFPYVKINLGDGKYFEIRANKASGENKYIQSARLNGQALDQAWFNHADIAGGGVLELDMGPVANRSWGAAGPPPPSAVRK
jgi:predicted alpha-1,2-mannosidase